MPGRPIPHIQETEYSCAPACLKMVLSSFDITMTEGELRPLTDCTSLGTDALSLVDAARGLGFSGTAKYSLSFDELREVLERGLWPIVYLRAMLSERDLPQTHAVVVELIDKENVHVIDPWRGRVPYSISNFVSEWGVFHGLTIIVEQD